MSYGGLACESRLEQAQKTTFVENVQENQVYHVENIVNDIVICNNGSNDDLSYTFSSLNEAFEMIQHDSYNKYRIMILESDDITQAADARLTTSYYNGYNVLPGIVPNKYSRYLDVEIIGVSSYDVISHTYEDSYELASVNAMNDAGPLRFDGDLRLTLKNIIFTGFGTEQSIPNNCAICIDFRGSDLSVVNCRFSQNGIGSYNDSSINRSGGVINFCPSRESELNVDNCLFADNQAPRADAVAITMGFQDPTIPYQGLIIGSTFANNSFTNQGGGEALHIEALRETLVNSCTFSGSDLQFGTPGNQVPISFYESGQSQPDRTITVFYSLFDQEEWFATRPSKVDETCMTILHTKNPGFTDMASHDYRLRWDSICMDKGSPERPVDFDQTNSDIGWVPVLPEITLTALPPNGQVTAAHYRLTGQAILSAPNLNIEAGAAFRVEGNFPLNLYSTANAFTMGDVNGPRTSVTTKFDVYSASSVVIGNDVNPVDANLNGWLLKDLPETGVTFAGLNGIRFSPDLEHLEYEPNMQVLKTIAAPLKFVKCSGDVVGVFVRNIDADNNWSTLSIGGGQMSVSHCDFRNNTNSSIPLTFASSSQSTVKDCVFNAFNDLSTRYSISQGGGSLYLRNNIFNDVRYRTIYNNMGNTMMDHGANNYFRYYSSGNPPVTPCVYSNYGRIDLECGYNAFVRFATPTGFRFVDTYRCFENWDWSRNFWGTDLSSPLSCAVAATHVPTCAAVSNCLSTWASNNPYWCPTTNNPDEELWALGQGAEEDKLWLDAIYYYSELVRIYPTSKFAPLAADRLKALGQKSLNLFVVAKAGLVDATLAAQAESADWLKGMAQASSLLLDAQYEDREGAIAILDSLSMSADSLEAAHAQFARLEAETLPQSSLNAADPTALWAARERRLAAWDRMFDMYNDQSGAGEVVEEEIKATVPTAFALSRVYPNPFNPFATLEIQNPIRQFVDVVVYNMVGARVATLHSGTLEAGVHSFVFDGSKRATGVYIAQATGGLTVSSQKLILLK